MKKCKNVFTAFSRIFFLIFLISCFGCRSVPQKNAGLIPSDFFADGSALFLAQDYFPYEQIAPGIEYKKVVISELSQIYHVTKIDLSLVDPVFDPPGSCNEEKVLSEFTLNFARRTGSTVAINTTPYGCKSSWDRISPFETYFTSSGIIQLGNEVLCSPWPNYAQLSFFEDGRGKIYKSQQICAERGHLFSLGGFYLILNDGKPCGTFKPFQDARTAAGLSEDGRFLFVLSAEGGQQTSCKGVSFSESALILQHAGAWTALEFDGGDSSALVVNGKNVFSYVIFSKSAVNLGFIPR
ncbi:MAG: phosphodiester glycosidase family protein [Treponemataceae bacterium]|nr:phosphodiester glycosidase family protein [Treponemataceae bacterium]